MKRFATFKVRGQEWEAFVADETDDESLGPQEDGSFVYGLTYAAHRCILIWADLTPEEQAHYFEHEKTHAYYAQYTTLAKAQIWGCAPQNTHTVEEFICDHAAMSAREFASTVNVEPAKRKPRRVAKR